MAVNLQEELKKSNKKLDLAKRTLAKILFEYDGICVTDLNRAEENTLKHLKEVFSDDCYKIDNTYVIRINKEFK